MLVLKSVDAALRDRDRIYAVIAGSGANQDGHTMGITVPNGVAQRDLAQAVCKKANLAPHEIGYVEAHGTGTPVGDPIEVTALGLAKRTRRSGSSRITPSPTRGASSNSSSWRNGKLPSAIIAAKRSNVDR